MRLAIFSDIHANWEALEKAVAHARDVKVDAYAVLGDTVGYGANPNECFDWARKHAAIYVTGNHEKALVDPRVRESFTEWAYEAIVWTDGVISPDLKKEMAALPYLKIENGLTF